MTVNLYKINKELYYKDKLKINNYKKKLYI